jgi:valyl-tRNA synthetase
LFVVKSDYAIPGGNRDSSELLERIRGNRAALHRLARVDRVAVQDIGIKIELDTGEEANRATVEGQRGRGPQIVVQGITYALPVSELIDLDAEKARLSKAAAAAEKECDSLAQRLANPNFTERAKPEAVGKARADHEAKAAEANRLRAALERLG